MTISRRTALATLTQTALMAGVALGPATDALARAGPSLTRPFLNLPIKGTVLFQGDSITDGGRWREGQDYNHIMGQDYAYVIAGHYGAGFPEWNLNFVNRGISGNTVMDLSTRWKTDTLDLKPDLLSILVGVNDVLATISGNKSESAETYAQTYEQLIQKTLAALPAVRIVLCTPFVLPVGARTEDHAAWRVEIDQRISAVAKIARQHKLPLVPFHAALDDACKRAAPDHWSWDGVHPTYAGHYLMAQTWMNAVEAFS